MEKERLVSFIATIMEDSGFKIKKNYAIANQIIDIYGVLETPVSKVGVVVACKNYEEPWKIGLDVIKDMEVAARVTHASKIIIFTTSSFTHGAAVYAQKRNIKLVDRKGLVKIAKNYAQKRTIVTEPIVDEDDYDDFDYYERRNRKPASLTPNTLKNKSHRLLSRNHNKGKPIQNTYSSRNYPKRTFKDKLSFDVTGLVEFFGKHSIIYLIILILISTIIAYILNTITAGPYTGVGKLATSAIVCYGGLLVVDRDLSDLLFKGTVIFFISLLISIVMLTV